MLLADASPLDSLVLHFFFDGGPDEQLPEGPGVSSWLPDLNVST